ncbi:MAG: methyltransferase domain-containing protein, partial [bacterium]
MNSFFVTGDAESLPFSAGSFDLVVSSASYQWMGSMRTALSEANRVLSHKGFFVSSLFGAQTLNELRDVFNAATDHNGRFNHFKYQDF